MTEENQAIPVWGYKKTKDGFETKLFKDGKLPKGWKDTPAGMNDDDRS